MKTLELNKQYALVTFTKTVLESCNPEIVEESDSIDELQNYYDSGCSESGSVGYTIIEKTENGLEDYFSGEKFEMKSYN